jgi:hypothetical protein
MNELVLISANVRSPRSFISSSGSIVTPRQHLSSSRQSGQSDNRWARRKSSGCIPAGYVGNKKTTTGEWLEILPTQKLSKARTAEVERIDALLEAEQAGTARDGLQDNQMEYDNVSVLSNG